MYGIKSMSNTQHLYARNFLVTVTFREKSLESRMNTGQNTVTELVTHKKGVVSLHEDLTKIWNGLWKIYKEFLIDHNVKEYTRKASELVHSFDGNEKAKSFCQNIIFSWAPIINDMAAEYRREKDDANS